MLEVDAAPMFSLPRRLMALATVAFLAASPASAATLSVVDLTDPNLVKQDNGVGAPEQPVLFSTTTARDQNLQNNGVAGRDIFLKNPSGTTLASRNFAWAASGTVYNWSLSYNGTRATFRVGTNTITSLVTNGTWNVVKFFLQANDTARFTTSTVTLTTDLANGKYLDTPLTFTTTNSTLSTLTYALDNFQTITSLSGTMKFDFTRNGNAGGSPQNRLSWGITTQQVAPVPLPAAMPMSMAALAMIGWITRRRKTQLAA